MRIYLLTHERELDRLSGTGSICDKELDYLEIIPWKRKEPAPLFDNIDAEKTVLIYPGKSENPSIDLNSIENFILIDGTWQEARKVYNRSPYLRAYKEYEFKNSSPSIYNLRRNQIGLCTAESVIELLKLLGREEDSKRLYDAFILKLSS